MNLNQIFIGLLSVCFPLSAFAASSDFSQFPPGLSQNSAPPVVMLAMPKDHQLFFKAYSDYEDINGDTTPETTYNPSIDYIGYFDNKLCYGYYISSTNTTIQYFEPQAYAKQIVTGTPEGNQILVSAVNTNTTVAATLANNDGYYCNTTAGTSHWSGNFLNWASMTKIDIIRHVLYGGKRAATQPTSPDGVLLERARIPGDAHSFAKYYGDGDLPFLTPYSVDDPSILCTNKDLIRCPLVKKGITLCNTTFYTTSTLPGDDHELSQNTANESLIRVARGNFSLWATSERFQCRFKNSPELEPMFFTTDSAVKLSFNAETTGGGLNKLMEGIFSTTPSYYFYHHSPSDKIVVTDLKYYEPAYPANATQKIGDFQAKVVACDKDFTAFSSNCTPYGTTLKPTGILQSSDPSIYWGLISGSFDHNKNGAALRKNAGPISSEIDSSGNFIAPAAGGLIAFLDNVRIADWGYAAAGNINANLRSSYVGWSNCGADENTNFGKLATFTDQQCRSWGNPFSEILMQSYEYLAGKTTPLVSTSDEDQFKLTAAKKAMTSPKWIDNPLAKNPATDTTTNLKSCSKLNVLAINGSSVSYDDETNFSNVKLTGYKAKTKIIGDNELVVGTNYFTPGIPATDAQGTAVCLPTLNASGAKIDLSTIKGICPEAPALEGSYLMAGMAYQANTTKINQYFDNGVQTAAISLSMGAAQIEIPTASNKVVILPACRNKATINSVFLGSCALVDFKIMARSSNGDSGTYLVVWEDAQQGGDFDQDVIQLIKYAPFAGKIRVTTSILSTSTNDKMDLGYNIAGVESSLEGYHGVLHINSTSNVTEAFTDYTPNTATNKSLKSPLYYAAKWGGFKDIDNNGIISSSQEWDKYNNATSEPYESDGIPDNYSEVINPNALYADIRRLLENIGPTVFSYSTNGSISVLDDNTGFNISTLFRPTISSTTNGITKTLNWTSSVGIYARDSSGYLHEDTNRNGKFDATDNIITFESQTETADTFAKTHTAGQKPTSANVISSNPLSDLNFSNPYWSAEKNLARVTNYSTQAAYTDNRSLKRYIFTAIDANNDDIINGSDLTAVPFDSSANGFPATGTNSIRSRWLATTAANMPAIVNYIRGKESSSFRGRRLDFIPSFSNDADDNPTNTLNDGLEPWLLGDIVHSSPLVVSAPKAAYDRYFGDDTYTTFRTQYANRRNVVYVGANDGMLHAFNLGKFDFASGQYLADTNYALGAELWAYVPFNLLPHLKWLTEKNYQHNYYVDGTPKSYDVNIFSNDADHPGGWGTLLIVPMRTGGTPHPVDSDGNGTNDRSLHSAVILMDVTNPDKAPKLLAEIPLPDNTYTTVNPDVVKFRTRGSDFKFNGPGATNQWYLALASGVTDPKRYTSTTAPKLYLYDLSVSNGIRLVSNVTISSNPGWVGGINARDWNGDFKDDYLYFGTVEGSISAQAGQLFRVSVKPGAVLGTPTPVLSVTNQSFAATPFTVVDKKGQYWVFTGTGRYFSDDDNLYNEKQNSYYAIKETLTETGINTTTAVSELANLTGVSVKTDDTLTQTVSFSNVTATNRATLEDAISKGKGWYFNFQSVKSRNYTSTILVNNALLFNTYEPGNACTPLGSSSQYKRDFLTGIPTKRNNTSTVTTLDQSRTIGIGAASDPVPGKNAATNTSLGAIDLAPDDDAPSSNVRQSWRELPYDR